MPPCAASPTTSAATSTGSTDCATAARSARKKPAPPAALPAAASAAGPGSGAEPRSPARISPAPRPNDPHHRGSAERTAAVTGPAAHAISASLRRRQAARIAVEASEERTATTRPRRGGGPSCPPVQHGSCPGNPASSRERIRRGCARPQAPARIACFRPFVGDETHEGCGDIPGPERSRDETTGGEPAGGEPRDRPGGARSKLWRRRPLHMRIAGAHGAYVPVRRSELPQQDAAASRYCRITQQIDRKFCCYLQYRTPGLWRSSDAAKRGICGVNV